MFVKNRHLQILPDGTVNGTQDDTSIFTILQRSTIGVGKMKIQGTATCQYLCMDACGFLYGTKEFGDECIFNENIEHNYYNTYSSAKYSNDKRTMYLALNRKGQSRKVLLKAKQPLGKLSSYTRVLTRYVSPERTEELHHMRHHGHMCLTPTSKGKLATPEPRLDILRCRRRRRKKKKKKKCGEADANCLKDIGLKKPIVKCSGDVECQRKLKNKKVYSEKGVKVGLKKRNPRKFHRNKKIVTSTSTEHTTIEDHEYDYGLETSTHPDEETTTLTLLESSSQAV